MNKKKIAGGWLAATVAFLGTAEGMRTVAYRDPVGIPTVCVGETLGVHMGDHYTREQCEDKLKVRVAQFDREIAHCIKVPLSDGQHVAVVSFGYNIGSGGACRSSFLRKLNEQDPHACDELLKYVYARGVKLPGLAKRREEERQYCLS